MSTSIFFSHNSQDRDWCELLAEDARRVGVATYLAEHDQQPGRRLADKVKTSIKACDAFVVLLTGNTASATYVHQEIGYALAHGKLVIPLVQPGVGRTQLAMLDGVEYIEFDFESPRSGRKDFTAAVGQLAQRQKRQLDPETLIAVGACVALLVLLMSDSGGRSVA